MRIRNYSLCGLIRRAFSAYSRPIQQTIQQSEFIQRRDRLLDLLGESITNKSDAKNIFALLLSRPKTFSAPDVPHVYRQYSEFRYLCGVDRPQFRLLIGSKESVLFVQERTENQILWDGADFNLNQLQRISGVNQVLPMNEFSKYVIETLQNAHLAVDIGTLIEAASREFDLKQIYQILSSGGWKHISLNDKIDQLRWIKSEIEQSLMRETSRIGSEAINSMFRECRGVTNESKIVGYLEYECRSRGANFLAYPPVVAGGENANTIHYISSNMPIQSNECVLVDAGSYFEGYVSDITRCFPVSGTFSTSQKTLYDALCYIQSELLHYVQNTRPLRLNELYNFMLERMVYTLSSIVFFRKNFSEEELIKECDKLCPHHVSHYLGMDVHDTPSISRAIDCVPGVVITVEPGIYIRPENTAVRDEFRGLGFRIEDNVLLTEKDAEILTANCLRNTDEIEFAMRY